MSIYNTKKKFNRIDYVLVIGVILAPMTGLRIGKIGPAEALVLLWCLSNISNMKKMNFKNYNVVFWILFLYAISFGTIYALLFYPIGTRPMGIITYLYLSFISIGIYYGLKKRTSQNIESILYRITIFGGGWYVFLYMYSKFLSTRFLGAPLWYGTQRFSGGGTNPHQIAVFISAIVFLSYYFSKNRKKKFEKIISVVNLFAMLYIGIETKSATLTAAIVVTFMILVIIEFIHLNKKKKDKTLISVLSVLIFFIVLALGYEHLYNFIFDWISSDPNGLGRISIFESIRLPISKSPFFGLGPGTHAWGGVKELHNTYLEVFAMGGILGSLIFTIYTFKIFYILKQDFRLAFSIIPLYIYGLAGFAMRRLLYWSILMIVVSLAEKMINDKNFSISEDTNN